MRLVNRDRNIFYCNVIFQMWSIELKTVHLFVILLSAPWANFPCLAISCIIFPYRPRSVSRSLPPHLRYSAVCPFGVAFRSPFQGLTWQSAEMSIPHQLISYIRFLTNFLLESPLDLHHRTLFWSDYFRHLEKWSSSGDNFLRVILFTFKDCLNVTNPITEEYR